MFRIAMYSHDALGMGHLRRNQLIARAFRSSTPKATVLLVAGAADGANLSFEEGIDWLILPALRKSSSGAYLPRRLEVPAEELLALRSHTICAALEVFEPDLLIVDKKPRGVCGELELTLESLRKSTATRVVLGLRDVLDDPDTVRREWQKHAYEQAVEEYYDAIWVYGDPQVYDVRREYQFRPNVAAKVQYVGYLDRRLELPKGEVLPEELQTLAGDLVLCLVGGGEDGAQLAEAFAAAELPRNVNGVLVTGPFMPADVRERLQRAADRNARLRVLRYVRYPELLLERADRVIAMGGYNTVCEILAYEKQGLIVPRVHPRREQLIRAERLRDLGLIEMLHPDELSPRALTDWLNRPPQSLSSAHACIDLEGLSHLPQMLEELMTSPRFQAADPHDALLPRGSAPVGTLEKQPVHLS